MSSEPASNVDFVRYHLFEGYFLEDLNSVVNKLDRAKIGDKGHCGYVAVQIILAGMECLGMIASGGKQDEKAFNYYYDNFFSKTNNKYQSDPLKKIFRNTLRNGTAHYFFTKAGIGISLNELNYPHLQVLKYENGDHMIHIAVSKLYEDFLSSYSFFKQDWRNYESGCNAIMADINTGQFCVNAYAERLSKGLVQ